MKRCATAMMMLFLLGCTHRIPVPSEAKFRAETIDDKIEIGYGVAAEDVDGDHKIDILVADKKQIVWYRNPGWEKYVIAENLTRRDNVCLAAKDLDGDGKCELAVGADWAPNDRENSGAVFYLVAPSDRTQRWEPIKLHAEPTVHRMKWMPLTYKRPGPWGLVVAPLHGRGKNSDAGSRILLYHKPDDPRAEWKTQLIDDTMHDTHNFFIEEPRWLYIAGREGVKHLIGEHSWSETAGISAEKYPDMKGVGEFAAADPSHSTVIFRAAIEPMHGHQLVTYMQNDRRVISSELNEGHALAIDDIVRGEEANHEIVVGWRGGGGGVRVFTAMNRGTNGTPRVWRETVVDNDGMACEDLCLADLNGDKRLDIIASGRATKNVKIYWNETPAP
jgi:hypothetical protein